MRKCKCGNPVRSGKQTQYHRNKSGELKAYVYENNRCNACENAENKKYKANQTTQPKERLTAY